MESPSTSEGSLRGSSSSDGSAGVNGKRVVGEGDRKQNEIDQQAENQRVGELIRRCQAGVWRYLRALGCEAALADDLTQETFLKVLQHRFEERSDAATSAYLRRVAYNLLVTTHRKSKRLRPLSELEMIDRSWTEWANQDNGEALLATLRQCLEELTDRARMALSLRFAERRSRAAIAEALALTEHGAKNLMQRAKQKLRICIEGKLA